MKRNNSFFRQMSVLTSRYIKIFFNDKQNLLLTITIPLLTIIIVALVASGDMYSPKTKMDHRINDGFPILAWQQAVQEDSDEFTVNTDGIGTIDDEDEPCLYIVFDKNKYDEFSNEQFIIKTKDGNKVFEEKGSKLKRAKVMVFTVFMHVLMKTISMRVLHIKLVSPVMSSLLMAKNMEN